jgi:hypothetical protein
MHARSVVVLVATHRARATRVDVATRSTRVVVVVARCVHDARSRAMYRLVGRSRARSSSSSSSSS